MSTRDQLITVCCLIVLTALSGCKQSDEVDSLRRQTSKKNQLTLVFAGEKMGGKIFPSSIYVRNDAGVRTGFRPADSSSVEQSAFAFEPVWSPTGEWLVLPNGRFEGFAVFKAANLPRALGSKSDMIPVGVCDENGTRYWHDFVAWKSASVFRFKAGLSGEYFEFECDLRDGSIVSVEKPRVAFRKF